MDSTAQILPKYLEQGLAVSFDTYFASFPPKYVLIMIFCLGCSLDRRVSVTCM